jgi:hypothetical protein
MGCVVNASVFYFYFFQFYIAKRLDVGKLETRKFIFTIDGTSIAII